MNRSRELAKMSRITRINVSLYIKKVCYVLGGPNVNSETLENQYWMKFAEGKELFNSPSIGAYTTKALGWAQSNCNPHFIMQRGSSAFCKLLFAVG